jgi:hypothetical protein
VLWRGKYIQPLEIAGAIVEEKYFRKKLLDSRWRGKRLTSFFGGEMISMNSSKGMENVGQIPHGSGGSGGLSGGGG